MVIWSWKPVFELHTVNTNLYRSKQIQQHHINNNVNISQVFIVFIFLYTSYIECANWLQRFKFNSYTQIQQTYTTYIPVHNFQELMKQRGLNNGIDNISNTKYVYMCGSTYVIKVSVILILCWLQLNVYIQKCPSYNINLLDLLKYIVHPVSISCLSNIFYTLRENIYYSLCMSVVCLCFFVLTSAK